MKEVQDHYFRKAKKDHYVARSAYKLEEINQKHHLFKKGDKVLDLGCAPGSWLQYLSKVLGQNGLAVGIDRYEIKIALPDNVRFIQADINDLEGRSPGEFSEQYDAVISDMAPKTTGVRLVDTERSFQLCQMAMWFAETWLKPEGSLLVKSFQGSPHQRLLTQFREQYQIVKTVKPKSSRQESVELFLLGQKKRSTRD